MDANATTADQIKGAFHQIISRIAFVIVHHASREGHAIIVISGARDAKLLVNLHVYFVVLVVTALRNHLERFIKAVWDEGGAVYVLLEIRSDGSSGLRGDNHAIRETTTAEQIKFGVAIVEGNRSCSSSLQGVKRRSTTHGEGGAALGDSRTGGAVNRANAHNHVLALYQFSGMVEHERKSSAMEGGVIKRCQRFLCQLV